MIYLIVILTIIIIWREIEHYFEIRFYKQWVNELLERISGVSVKSKSKIISRPLTDEEESLLEAERDNHV